MNRALSVGGLVGLSIGVGVYWFFAQHWFVVAGLAATYAGAAYFYVAFDVSLLGRATRFDDRTDKLGYAIGLFGVASSPVAFAQYYETGEQTGVPLAILLLGVITFMHLASKAHQQPDGQY
jgi:hypothetical protein